jgi:hypothetical protein
MPATTNIIHLEGKGDEPLNSSMHGETILIAVMIGYPGSKVSDILIGDHVVQVSNKDLRKAYKIADQVCSENFAGG